MTRVIDDGTGDTIYVHSCGADAHLAFSREKEKSEMKARTRLFVG